MQGMRQQNMISLNNDWLYFFAENGRQQLEQTDIDLTMWIPLPSLNDWAVSSAMQSGADWFRREINLDDYRQNTIIRLVVDKTPDEVQVFFNGELLGEVASGRSSAFDISLKVAAGLNVIAMRLVCVSDQGGGSFGGVHLDVQARA
jgi:hypothetical protein